MKGLFEIAARVFRGDGIEAVHCASIAVVDERGNLTHYLGDPEFVTMTRSCIKPFQLMPLVASGAATYFDFDLRQLAIMAGSHNGTDEHREVVLTNLARAGNGPEHLQCGCHWPIGMEERRIWPTHGEDKDPVRHNCSGKHSGFLAMARYLKADVAQYLRPESPVQQRVLTTVSRYCGFPLDRMTIGVDGCSAPNFPLSLLSFARGFMKLAAGRGSDDVPATAAETIREAMMTYPEMVSGEGRFDLSLARAFPNRLICKSGAEAIEGIGLMDPPVGIAVKIQDGNCRALWPVCVEVLRQLGYIKHVDNDSPLARFERPEIRNVRDFVTGQIVPDFQLRKV
ncbi:MAG TPA: asparaginase [candidate division Zixibacteria bacterium]|nr:asparaginase [candidate division Zixibacteria bacterium]